MKTQCKNNQVDPLIKSLIIAHGELQKAQNLAHEAQTKAGFQVADGRITQLIAASATCADIDAAIRMVSHVLERHEVQ